MALWLRDINNKRITFFPTAQRRSTLHPTLGPALISHLLNFLLTHMAYFALSKVHAQSQQLAAARKPRHRPVCRVLHSWPERVAAHSSCSPLETACELATTDLRRNDNRECVHSSWHCHC